MPGKPVQLELFGGGRVAPSATPAPSRPGHHPAGPAPHPYPRLTPLPPPSRADLFRRLSRLTGGRLRSISLTDNRRTILSVRPVARLGAAGRRLLQWTPGSGAGGHGAGALLDLRIHHSFVAAPDPVLRAVAVFLESPRGTAASRQALAGIREHFQLHRQHALHALQPQEPSTAGSGGRRLTIDPVGTVLDLRELAADLNQRYFAGRLRVRITWGKSPGEAAPPVHDCRRTRTTSLQLGSYSYEDRLIRIHRVLDRPEVPRFVIESVVHHELLHADLPPVTRNGRRYFHTPEFRRRERQFRHFEKADDWVRRNLQQLLRARRSAATSTAAAARGRRR